MYICVKYVRCLIKPSHIVVAYVAMYYMYDTLSHAGV